MKMRNQACLVVRPTTGPVVGVNGFACGGIDLLTTSSVAKGWTAHIPYLNGLV
jgi:hypothetical protein